MSHHDAKISMKKTNYGQDHFQSFRSLILTFELTKSMLISRHHRSARQNDNCNRQLKLRLTLIQEQFVIRYLLGLDS